MYRYVNLLSSIRPLISQSVSQSVSHSVIHSFTGTCICSRLLLLCRYATFKGKYAVVMGASPGALGGMRAMNAHRDLLHNLGSVVLPNSVVSSILLRQSTTCIAVARNLHTKLLQRGNVGVDDVIVLDGCCCRLGAVWYVLGYLLLTCCLRCCRLARVWHTSAGGWWCIPGLRR